MEIATLVMSATALLFSGVTALTGIYALVLVKAAEKSTHSLQYVPIDPTFEKESTKQVAEINKQFKEYVEDEYSDVISEAY